MRKLGRLLLLAGLTALAGLILVACGGGSSSSGGTSGGTATVLMGTAPDYLDPRRTTRRRGPRPPGSATRLWSPTSTRTRRAATSSSPASPTALPQISSDQKTYTLTLRKGLVFSNGQPVKASDFKCTVERMIKVNWGGKCFVTDNVAGADRLRRGQGERHLGHHDRRRDRQDHDPARRSRTARSRTCSPSRELGWSRAGRRIHEPARPTRRRASGRT